MKKNLILLTIFITSCSPYIKSDFSRDYTSLKPNEPIKVLTPNIYLNRNNSKDLKIGNIIVGDKGATSNCDSITMLKIIKDSARVHGGNLIGLTKHIKPNIWGSSCHQFYADILRQNVIKTDSSTNRYVTIAQTIKKDTYKKTTFLFNVKTLKRTVNDSYENEVINQISKTLKKGTGVTFAGYYNFQKTSGLGLKYTYMKYGGSVNNVTITYDDGRPTEEGIYKTAATVNYYALSTRSNFAFGKYKKKEIILDSSLGYAKYHELVGINTITESTGSSLGYDINIGYSRKLDTYFNLGFDLGYFASSISKITISDGTNKATIKLDKDNALNLNNINAGISLSYNF
ncbi:hypothetical protein N9901_02440 [Flavobacteriaceae bacterium]|nr:hypothetical protein [Flavobacteriaceae bacterium]